MAFPSPKRSSSKKENLIKSRFNEETISSSMKKRNFRAGKFTKPQESYLSPPPKESIKPFSNVTNEGIIGHMG
jgi:hypothetical protein